MGAYFPSHNLRPSAGWPEIKVIEEFITASRDGKTLAEGEARHCDADDQRLIVTTPVYDKGEYRIALTER